MSLIKTIPLINDIYVVSLKICLFHHHKVTALHSRMITVFEGLPDPDPTASIALTTYLPSLTLPNTTCLLSNHAVAAVVKKNWLPFVSFPALAIDKQNGSCFSLKFSSWNLSPQIDLPPVPSPLVKSPPWIMNWGITLWNLLPWKASFSPLSYLSPRHRVTKFSTVLGTVLPNILMTMSPASFPSISIEKVTVWVACSYIWSRFYLF